MRYSVKFDNDVFAWGFALKYIKFPNRTKSLLHAFPNTKPQKMPPKVEQLCNSLRIEDYKTISSVWQTIVYCLEGDIDGLKDYFKLHFGDIYKKIDSSSSLEFFDYSDEEYIKGFVASILLCEKYEGVENIPLDYSELTGQLDAFIESSIRALTCSKYPVKSKQDVNDFIDRGLSDIRFWGDVMETSLTENDRDIFDKEAIKYLALLEVPKDKAEAYIKDLSGAGQAYAMASRIFAAEGLNLDEIVSRFPRKKEDTYNSVGLCQAICSLYRFYSPSSDYYAFCDVLSGLAKAYRSAGKCYRNELNKKAAPLAEKVDTSVLEAQLASSKEENRRLREKLEALEREKDKDVVRATRTLEKEIKGLRDENKRLTAMKTELDALRDFAFKVESETIDEPESVSLAEVIKDKKIAIIGGPEPFMVKMRGLYPDLTILSGTLLTLNTDMLPQFDHIFLYTSHMSHSLYYKVMNTCRARGLKYSYLGYHQNPKFLETEIMEGLRS